MKNEKESSHIAIQILYAALVTGEEHAILSVLQQHFPLPDEYLLAELQMVMVAYSTLLSHLDIVAAAMRLEFFELRGLIKQMMVKRFQDEKPIL